VDQVAARPAVDQVAAGPAVEQVSATAAVNQISPGGAEDKTVDAAHAELVVLGATLEPLARTQPNHEIRPPRHSHQAHPGLGRNLRIGPQPTARVELQEPRAAVAGPVRRRRQQAQQHHPSRQT
jgi:hypothetical protein